MGIEVSASIDLKKEKEIKTQSLCISWISLRLRVPVEAGAKNIVNMAVRYPSSRKRFRTIGVLNWISIWLLD